MTVLIGSSSAGVDSANSNLSGVAFAIRQSCLFSGTVTTLLVKSALTSTSQFHGAIYADSAGAPGNRLTADFTTPTLIGGWHSYAVSPGLVVTASTFYWLAFLAVGTTYNYTDNATSGGTERDGPTGATGLADPFGTPSGSFTNLFNAYADGTLSATATAPVPRRSPLSL